MCSRKDVAKQYHGDKSELIAMLSRPDDPRITATNPSSAATDDANAPVAASSGGSDTGVVVLPPWKKPKVSDSCVVVAPPAKEPQQKSN